MNKPAWTPGPWRHEDDEPPRGQGWRVFNKDGYDFALVYASADKRTASQAEANASLITAAPDLYEALDEAINYLAVYAATIRDEKASALLNKCTAALSRARGEQP